MPGSFQQGGDEPARYAARIARRAKAGVDGRRSAASSSSVSALPAWLAVCTRAILALGKAVRFMAGGVSQPEVLHLFSDEVIDHQAGARRSSVEVASRAQSAVLHNTGKVLHASFWSQKRDGLTSITATQRGRCPGDSNDGDDLRWCVAGAHGRLVLGGGGPRAANGRQSGNAGIKTGPDASNGGTP